MAVIPIEYRAAVRLELEALVRGARPDKLLWVRQYGAEGTTLVDQPEEIWTHSESEHVVLDDGTVRVLLPMWTVDQSPSDLTVDIFIDADGVARVYDLHVL